jgi:uncharacterized RDD family membrane protein YckC
MGFNGNNLPVVALLDVYSIFNFWLILLGIIILLYFTLMEGKWSTTLGKGLVNLKVQAKEGDMGYKKDFFAIFLSSFGFPGGGCHNRICHGC